jgi:hypothetical protein
VTEEIDASPTAAYAGDDGGTVRSEATELFGPQEWRAAILSTVELDEATAGQ